MKKDRKGSRNIIHKSGNPKEEKREFLCKTIRGYLRPLECQEKNYENSLQLKVFIMKN